MRTRFLKISLLCALFATGGFVTGCSDDNGYPDVDGESPVVALKTSHIQSGAGHDFTIEGTLTDADGISAIKLQCADLYLNKTIDLIEIYGEPQTSYDLSYKFSISKDEVGEQFTVKVTVVDVGGRETSQDVLITMDGDFEDPVFTLAPEDGSLVAMLLRDGSVDPYEMELQATDDRALKSLYLNIEGAAGYENVVIDIDSVPSFTYTWKIELPAEKKDYPATIAITDYAEKTDTIKCTISVTDVADFEKMYLADVATDADLNNDVFGVPMLVNHVGEYQYEALYYNAKSGTEIYFIPQATSFSPICYGLDPTDEEKLTDNRAVAKPIVLDQANVYYKINFNILEKTYSMSVYSLEEAQDPWDPTVLTYGEKCFDLWGDGSEYINFTFGLTSDNPTGVKSFTQDATNPHLFYSEPMELSAGEQMNFIIHNYHTSQWWNMVRWCSNTETDLDVFNYYTQSGSQNEKYTGPKTGNDVWSKPTVTVSGTYRFYFDSHLGRAKLVKE